MTHLLKKTLNNTVYAPNDGVQYWRERIFLNISLVLIILGAIAVTIGIVMALKVGHPLLALVDALAYQVLLFIFFNRSLKLKIRINILIYIFLSLSILLLFLIGHKSPWMIYLVGYNLLTALLQGLKATYRSLIITASIITFLAISIGFKLFNPSNLYIYTTAEFITISVNILVISSISSLPLAMLVKGLKETIDGQKRLQTMLKLNIREVAAAKHRAEKADRIKSAFLANISHEIRTPLNAINGFSSLLMEQKDYSKQDKVEMVKYINESGEYLLNIIDNVLDFSMIEANELKVYIDELSLSEMFQDLKAIYDPRIKNKPGVVLIFNPDCLNNTIQIRSDAKRLKQVFINLINNAFKYTEQGSIMVGFNENNEFIEFYVVDTGTGIEPQNLNSIFERFVKVDGKYNDQKEGTGLGLAISKGIAEVLNGTIHVESEYGKGSKFLLKVPIN